MGLFDKSALPEHLDEPGEWKGTDDDQSWFFRWRLYVKEWFAFGPRSPVGVALAIFPPPLLFAWLVGRHFGMAWSWWFLWPIFPVARKWRPKPFVIFGFCGKGNWRLERTTGGEASAPQQSMIWWDLEGVYYLSRVQYWTRWHVALQWPFCLQWHFYPKAKDVPMVMTRADTDGKLWFGYGGSHYDNDRIFWWPSAFLGRTWK